MATAKKPTKKPAKKTAKTAKPTAKSSAKPKPPAAKPATKKRAATPAVALSAEERGRLLKPRSGADDLAEQLVEIWSNERGLRVDDLSPAKLARLLERSRRANAKERALLDAQARKMVPVRDARLLADDALWRALLDLRASLALRARKDPSVEERFALLLDALRGTPDVKPAPEPTPPA